MINVLSSEEREKIFDTMTDFQIDVIINHVMYRVKSELLTASFWKGIHWELLGVNYDRLYRKKLNQRKYRPSLYCECGRPLKYQYVVKSKETGEILELGKECFTQRTGIPERIAEEIYNSKNKINIFQDEILSAYKFRKRFPLELYNEIHLNKVDDKWSPYYNKKILDLKKANLPLFHRDQDKLENDLIEYKVRKRQLKRLLGMNFKAEYTENYVYLIKYMENRILNDRKLNQGERKKLIQDLYKISKAVNESISIDFAKLSTNKRKLITVEYIDSLNFKIKNFNLSYKEALSESRNIARKIMDYANGKKIEKNTKIKQVTNKQVNINNTSNVRLDHGLNGIKKDTSRKSEVDILLKKEEEKIVELNALQVQLYGKDAVQDYRDVKENRSIEEIIDSISEIKKKYEEHEKIKHKYIHLINTYINFYPVLINRLNEISDKEIMLSNNIESEYTKMLEEYKKLPRLNEGENKIVRYFMFRHKVNIPGKGIKQGYSLSAIPIEKFKEVKSKDIQKLLLEYLILRVAIVEEIIHFKNKRLQDNYTKVKNIISGDGKYKSNKVIKSYNIELLVSMLISDGYSKNANITLNKEVELLRQKLEEIIKESGKREIVRHVLNSLVETYREKSSFNNDISNMVDSIIREGDKISYNVSSLPQWEQDFIDFLYELNYYYYGSKLSKDRKKVNVKVLNINLIFLRFINTKMRPIVERTNLSEQLIEIYGANIAEKIDMINKLSKVAKTKNKDMKTKEKSVLKISSKQLYSIIKVYRKCSNKKRKSTDWKLKKLERDINSLEIRDSLKKEIIFFEKNKKDILELQDAFKSKRRN